MKKEKVLVLMGGTSAEREISLRSGQAILKALQSLGYNAQAIDYNSYSVKEIIDYQADLVYIALHGQNGEDGSVQGMLDTLGIPYTGCGMTCSVLCMDKVLTKKLFSLEGIPCARFRIITQNERKNLQAIQETLIKNMGMPLVVKAATQGSSIGTYIVRKEADIIASIEKAFDYSQEVLVEEFIDGKELTVALIGNDDPQVLPIIEITSANEFYDYESKYTQGKCEHIIPARIEEGTRQEIISISKQVFQLMGCKGYPRIDFMLDKANHPYVLEVNTLPGMTEMSLVPDAARAAGIEFEDLVERILRLALEK